MAVAVTLCHPLLLGAAATAVGSPPLKLGRRRRRCCWVAAVAAVGSPPSLLLGRVVSSPALGGQERWWPVGQELGEEEKWWCGCPVCVGGKK